MTALLALGIVVTLLGAVVLLVFPDRPGGQITVPGVGGVNSAGAGLPLIVIGIVAVAYVASHGDTEGTEVNKPSTPSGTSVLPPPTSSTQTNVVSSTLPSTPSPPALTIDSSPCGAQFTPADDPTPTRHRAQRCVLEVGRVPVYESPDQGNSARQVGILRLPGDSVENANWFVGQSSRSTYSWGSYSNRWWAFTLSDKDDGEPSRWGWVPEVYFKGANNGPDAGLIECDTQGNFCKP